MRSKKSTTALKNKADRLYQLKYVSQNPYCIVCGSPTSCMHHVVYKSQSNFLRYSESNGVPICARCHTRHHLSGDPLILASIIKVRGMDWFEKLQKERHTICKLNKENLLKIIEELYQKNV